MPINVSEYEDLAGQMLTLYETAELRMLNRISNRLYKGSSSPAQTWTNKKYAEMSAVTKEIRSSLKELKKDRTAFAKKFIQTAYGSASSSFVSEAKAVANIAGISSLSQNSAKVVSILLDLNNTLNAEDRVILRQANDAYANIVGNVSALVATGTVTVREAVKRELDDFSRHGITGFVDKAGRHWEMSTYAEMATLTAIEKATVEGYVDTMQEYGYDLAIISSHAGACPICAAWEDVIVSVSGSSHDYPSLDDAEGAGVFHPRCLHHLSTYYPDITRGGKSRPAAVREESRAYSTRQQQRQYERNIRQWKRMMATASSAQEERYAYAHVRDLQSKIRGLISDYNSTTSKRYDWLPRKYWREGGQQRLSEAARKLKPVSLERQ